MCGIVGIASKTLMAKKEKDFFSQALYTDLLRGKDSTGIFTVGKDDLAEVEVFKKAYPSHDFMHLPRACSLINNFDKTAVAVGHNRAATKGGVNHNNAHPFQHGNITLVHNGTLTNYNQLAGFTHTAVDSALLCRSIDEIGVQETVNKVTGAYALVWHDASDNTLHFLRNDKREFSMAVSEDGKSLYWASELKMLEWLLDRNNIETTEAFLTEENLHISFDLSEAEFKPTTETVEKEVQAVTYSRNTANSTGGTKTKKDQSERIGEKEARRKAVEAGVNIPKIGDRVEGYFWGVEKYKQGTLGSMQGVGSEPDLYCNMEIHGIPSNSFAEGYYSFDVIAVQYVPADDDFIIRGRNPSLEIRFDNNNEKMEKVQDVVEGTVTKKPSTITAKPLAVTHEKSTKSGVLVEKKADEGTPEAAVDGLLSRGFVDTNPSGEDYPFVGPSGLLCNEKVFNELTKHGCSNCCRDLDTSEHEEITWLDTQTPVCLECASEDAHFNTIH